MSSNISLRIALEKLLTGWTSRASNGTSNQKSDDEDDKLELIRLAQDLQKASRATRVRYKHPHVHFVLPNVFPGRVAEIDRILATIHSTGASTSCAPDHHPRPTPLHKTFAQMLPFSTRQLSQTLNIDCTILLALVSDLSHYHSSSIPLEAASGAKDGTPHPASVRQLKLESEEQLLTNILYPLLQSKTLVCTSSAARRMREIVHVIGTEGEKARTDLFISSSPQSSTTTRRTTTDEEEENPLHTHLRTLSHYPLPPALRLPIHIIPADETTIDFTRLPPIAANIARQLSDINRSVFLYGWQEGFTTVSSNRAVARGIEAAFEEQGSEDPGPDVWLVGTARSLVGKEKGRG